MGPSLNPKELGTAQTNANTTSAIATTLLNNFKSKEGNITQYAPGGLMIITDTGANIRRMLHLIEEIDVGSPFDYEAHARLYIPAAFPKPNEPGKSSRACMTLCAEETRREKPSSRMCWSAMSSHWSICRRANWAFGCRFTAPMTCRPWSATAPWSSRFF